MASRYSTIASGYSTTTSEYSTIAFGYSATTYECSAMASGYSRILVVDNPVSFNSTEDGQPCCSYGYELRDQRLKQALNLLARKEAISNHGMQDN
jgi:hypothetical protein